MNKEEVLAWIRGFEAANRAAYEQTRVEPLDPERSFAWALQLIDLARQGASGGVLERGKTWSQEVQGVRDRWRRLREARGL